MLSYQIGALSGSAANSATSSTGRAISMMVVTSTLMSAPGRSSEQQSLSDGTTGRSARRSSSVRCLQTLVDCLLGRLEQVGGAEDGELGTGVGFGNMSGRHVEGLA